MKKISPLLNERKSGILLHISSLPGPYGVGELGPTARAWIDWLAERNQHLWQILPLHPVGFGFSPYQTTSIFAAEPLYISLQQLQRDDLLEPDDFRDFPQTDPTRVDYEHLFPARKRLLTLAAKRFLKAPSGDYLSFLNSCDWLQKYATYVVLREELRNHSWTHWPEPYRTKNEIALSQFSEKFREAIEIQKVWQYFFHQQWQEIRQAAAKASIQIIGDMPIFVAHNSADVWQNPELFDLQKDGSPRVVAGVPPDYFSSTGQRWGNPLYRWTRMKKDGYQWWIQRIKRGLELADVIRLDHFRGFVDYWEISAQEKTAIHGRWKRGPGQHFFNTLQEKLGNLPLIVEDLGLIGNNVLKLRDKFGLPGIRPLLFALDEDNDRNPFLPTNYPPNCVAYSGTHDNETIAEFFSFTSYFEYVRMLLRRAQAEKFLPKYLKKLPFPLRLLAWQSTASARWLIFPIQDLMMLGKSGRMNCPGTVGNNWRWKLDKLPELDKKFLREIGRRGTKFAL